MEKKIYEMPAIKVKQLIEDSSILAASGETNAPQTIVVSDDETISNGYVDAKQNTSASIWDEE